MLEMDSTVCVLLGPVVCPSGLLQLCADWWSMFSRALIGTPPPYGDCESWDKTTHLSHCTAAVWDRMEPAGALSRAKSSSSSTDADAPPANTSFGTFKLNDPCPKWCEIVPWFAIRYAAEIAADTAVRSDGVDFGELSARNWKSKLCLFDLTGFGVLIAKGEISFSLVP